MRGFVAKRTDQQLLRTNIELERRGRQRATELSAINEELKKDIRERLETEALLSASQELNERLIEALPGGVVQVSKDGAILRANPEALRILGLGYDEMLHKYVVDFETTTVFEDGRPALASDYPLTRAISTGTTQPAMTLGLRKPSGEISWAVFRAVPMRDPATQEINGAGVSVIDTTQ